MFSADLGVTPSSANYIEDVFSTYLYTGTGANQTITNGIDLSTKGGMVWTKGRSAAQPNSVFDTARGATNQLVTNSTAANNVAGTSLTAFTSTGFTLGAYGDVNSNGTTMVSWTFRKQAKFFDVVTYTGNGTSGRTISHNLGSVPGCIIVKCTSTAGEYWAVYHRSIGATKYLWLQDTIAASTSSTYWNDTSPTSSVFSVGNDGSVNGNGKTYVAYIFAHDAGGFGATGADNVISCGSFTTDGSGNVTVTLGWEPQFLIVKRTDSTDSWKMLDNMRGWPNGSNDSLLYPNLANAEAAPANYGHPTATGFAGTFDASAAHIYIAIRRGPMKTPTTGTSVFGLSARTGTGANATVTGGQTDDAVLIKNRGSAVGDLFAARLTGTGYLETSSTAAEVAAGTTILQANPWDVMDGVKVGTTSTITNASGNTFINYLFRRAPGFFDVVCYTGTGTNLTVNHNLGVVPELMILKGRSSLRVWAVYSASILNTEYLRLDSSLAKATGADYWNSTTPTSSVFSVGTNVAVNTASATQIAYLFATVAGVSKVGSYTGTGTTNQINCGFTGGARFVLIKRTDSTGSWWVFDSARGIVPGNDPALQLNSTAAEVTTVDAVDADSIGFVVNQETTCNLNVNGGTYVFLAVS